jgi:glycosyltransferase involved in cell wall biosynthesis
MRVLINALSARLGGGQTYLYNLLDFSPENKSTEIFLLGPDSLGSTAKTAVRQLDTGRRAIANPFVRAAWERTRMRELLRKLEIDILFCPGGIIGIHSPGGCRTVTMFRNMIPFDPIQRQKYPLGYQRLRNWILHRQMLDSMLRADLVIFVSRFAKNMVERHAGRQLKRSVVIPHGIHPRFRVSQDARQLRPGWLPQEPYLLYVSTLDFYKAQIEVIQAYAKLRKCRETREKLMLVGPQNRDYGRRVRSEINRLGLANDVLLAGIVPYDNLPGVYQHAKVNIFASESENCPNILLEALAAGRPVLSSNRPPMPEFGGDAVIYFDPSDPEELARKLTELIDDPVRMKAFSQKALERSHLYDWGTTARLTWEAIGKLSGSSSLS